MFENAINSKKQGDIGMCYAIAYYSKLGWTISIPITDSQDYDLIIDTGANLLKVQVKTTKYKRNILSNVYSVSLKISGGNKSGSTIKTFDKNDCDLLFVLTDSGDCYSIPRNEITAVTSINLTEKYLPWKVNLF